MLGSNQRIVDSESSALPAWRMPNKSFAWLSNGIKYIKFCCLVKVFRQNDCFTPLKMGYNKLQRKRGLLMASNSDSLYNVLTKLQHHPELVMTSTAQYQNTVSLLFKDSVSVADAAYYFPEGHLMVNRLSPDFVAKNGALLDDYYQLTAQGKPGYHDVWVTTSHLPKRGAYLLELSYE